MAGPDRDTDPGRPSLLNTAEAARLLRTSQASIRRWSDAGLLPDHRVGRRRERRFREADLLAFMDRSVQVPAGAPSVKVAGLDVRVPAHFATLFSSDEGGLRLTVPFLAEGLRLRQPTIVIAAGKVLERYAKALDLREVRVITRFNGSTSREVIPQFEQLFSEILAAGPTVIRLVGEPAVAREWFTSEDEFLRFEEDFEVMSRRYPVAVICQYDVRRFDGVALLRALKAHPDFFNFRTGAFLN